MCWLEYLLFYPRYRVTTSTTCRENLGKSFMELVYRSGSGKCREITRSGDVVWSNGDWFLFDDYPLPSNRHRRSNGRLVLPFTFLPLEGKRENYQVCSVLYCAPQLYTVQCTHIWTDLTVLWIGFCLTGPISLCLDSFLYMHYCMHV